jgi:ribosomal protein S18 acetylase RimI-like enzyme
MKYLKSFEAVNIQKKEDINLTPKNKQFIVALSTDFIVKEDMTADIKLDFTEGFFLLNQTNKDGFIEIDEFFIRTNYKGQGFGSKYLRLLCKNSIVLTGVTISAKLRYSMSQKDLEQPELEAFYKRYGFEDFNGKIIRYPKATNH